MKVRMLLAVLAMGKLLEGTGVASHTPLLTKDEEKCQLKAAGALAKFRTAVIKCMEKCDRDVLRSLALPSDCSPPSGGGVWAACFQKATTKAIATIPKKCVKDCPECYSSGICSVFAATQVPGAAGNIAVTVNPLFCYTDDNLTADEAKCRQKMALVGAKYAAGLAKCRIKCRKAEFAKKLPLGVSCEGPTNDPKTLACFDKLLLKFTTDCQAPCSDTPDCSPLPPDCAFFGGTLKDHVAQYDSVFFCML